MPVTYDNLSLQDYELRHQLGAGTYGEVYYAVTKGTALPRAVKVSFTLISCLKNLVA